MYAAPQWLARRQLVLRCVSAMATGFVVSALGLSPTGLAQWDQVAMFAVAGLASLLAAHARPGTLVAAASLCALASLPSPAGLLAFMVAGGAFALVLGGRPSALLSTVMGGGLVVGSAWLNFDGPQGAETVVGCAVVGSAILSGYLHLCRPTPQLVVRAAVAVVTTAAMAALFGAVALARARPALVRAVDAASSALRAARSADAGLAVDQFELAGADFLLADGSVGAWWARPARLIPIIGQNVRALEVVADSGADLVRAGRSVASAFDLDAIRIRDGRIPVDLVAALSQPLGTASATATRVATRIRAARSAWLLPPIADRLDAGSARLSAAGESLARTRELVSVLPAMLGANGPRHWFLAIQTPSEARASGGIIGNFGEILADQGRLRLSRFGRTGELNSTAGSASRVLTGPADYLARYRRFDPMSIWQNVTMSPDFPSVGAVIRALYPQSSGRQIDGVIAIDPAGVAAFLRLTGPIQMEKWPAPIKTATARRILEYEQYFLPQDERIDFLSDLTQALFDKLTTGELPALPQILAVLGEAVHAKHLLITAAAADEEDLLDRFGMNGAIAPVRGDALGVVTQNAGGNKIDWFLRRTVDYRPSVDPVTRSLTARLTVTLKNGAPGSGLPDYLIGSFLRPPPPLGTNRLYLSVYSPWNLTMARLDDIDVLVESELELGRHVYSLFVDIPPGGRVVLEMDFSGVLPTSSVGYRLDLHAQALAEPDEVVVALPSGREERLVLDRDRTLLAGPLLQR